VLVALVLTALAAGGVAVVAATSGRALSAARHDATGASLAVERLERMRAGARGGGADVVVGSDGTAYVRRWSAVAGRGRADALDATITWASCSIALATEVAP
jgi:hypothetical protein